MTCISYFYGIRIYLYPNDHYPAHFHVKYADFQAKIDIATGAITKGSLPPKARVLTEEWRLINQNSLIESFELMVKCHQVKKIEGLK